MVILVIPLWTWVILKQFQYYSSDDIFLCFFLGGGALLNIKEMAVYLTALYFECISDVSTYIMHCSYRWGVWRPRGGSTVHTPRAARCHETTRIIFFTCTGTSSFVDYHQGVNTTLLISRLPFRWQYHTCASSASEGISTEWQTTIPNISVIEKIL